MEFKKTTTTMKCTYDVMQGRAYITTAAGVDF